MTYRKGKIHDISLDLIHRDVNQPRKHFDESEPKGDVVDFVDF